MKIALHSGDPGSDAGAFNTHEIPSVCIAWDYFTLGNHPYYHTSNDTVENVNINILDKATRLLTSAIYFITNKISRKNVRDINGTFSAVA